MGSEAGGVKMSTTSGSVAVANQRKRKAFVRLSQDQEQPLLGFFPANSAAYNSDNHAV
jgi:hypothetical protein